MRRIVASSAGPGPGCPETGPVASGGRRDRTHFQCVPRKHGSHRPVEATLVLARVRSNRPDGPSFKPRWLALSSGSPMSAETQAVLFNAVPLLILAALYLAVGLALAPALWRERGQAHEIGFATALVFPAVGLALAVLGVETLVTQEALTGDPLVGLIGILLAAVPLVAIVR